MASLFTKIINGEIPSYKVAESEECYAFLDINPLVKGHTLVIPKIEVDYIFDLDESTYTALHTFAKKVALAIDEVMDCERVGIAVIGLEVPHAHIHLVPLNEMQDINFSRPKLKVNGTEMQEIANEIAVVYKTLS